MSRTRGRSPGWAAFDIKQREKQGVEPELDVDPYPPMPNITSVGPTKNYVKSNLPSEKTFSSVLQPSMDFPILIDGSKCEILVGNSSRMISNQISEKINAISILEKLKKRHSWADDCLVEDILASVNNDENKACTLLKAMASTSSDWMEANCMEPSVVPDYHLCEKKNECLYEQSMLEDQLSDSMHRKLILGNLHSVPIEPEWEEDDVYLSHRKDAIRKMRSASQHSRAASNAFLRGDHFSAHHLSLKARGEWLDSNKLNAKAAEKILCIRNDKNDMWKLDLHGLHASEAVHALEARLHRIESQMLMSHPGSSEGTLKPEAVILRVPSVESSSCLDMQANADKQLAVARQRQTVLQVITGSGNHSRGQAALPTAVRSFLIENRYHFDDARPGVFAVRPKFRHR